MHPAPSIIAFTTLSGLGFGLLFWLGVDATPPTGGTAFVFFAIGYGLTALGLVSSALHLGRRERALKAFSQWRTSWLSREAWAALATLIITGLHALLLIAGIHFAPLGWLSALLCLGTVVTTSMIYAQLKTVPRWHHWSTPVLFTLYAIAGGGLLSGRTSIAIALMVVTALVQLYVWMDGDTRLARSGTTLVTATGLGAIGTPRAFEAPHTGNNYLLREMVYTVARKHIKKLRIIALALMAALPVLFLMLPFNHILALLAVLSHLAGVLTARWLFFAEAEHVVGLYYGKR